jgi:hypothetical protein
LAVVSFEGLQIRVRRTLGMVFRNSHPQLAAIDGDVTWSSHAQPNPLSLDLNDGDFDVCPEDDPLPDFA